MAVTRYYTVQNLILGQRLNSDPRINYTVSALGSVEGTVEGQSLANSYRYKPYGSTLARSGPHQDPKFLWIGTRGYRSSGLISEHLYVRSRHYSSVLARWNSVDGLWPNQRPYAYSLCSPLTRFDPSGLCPPLVSALGGPIACQAWDLLSKAVGTRKKATGRRAGDINRAMKKNPCSKPTVEMACIAMACSFKTVHDFYEMFKDILPNTWKDLLKTASKQYGEEMPTPEACCAQASNPFRDPATFPGIVGALCSGTDLDGWLPEVCAEKHKNDSDNGNNNCTACCGEQFKDSGGNLYSLCLTVCDRRIPDD